MGRLKILKILLMLLVWKIYLNKCKDIKVKEADQLTGEERKKFAEKVILSLWKNIGDGEDESDDNDDADL
ncbi:unnamed protein product [Rotaria socialis]